MKKYERLLLVLVGPTGIGKTKISLKLAPLIKAEIISADSRQIYKFLDIGTAKPNLEEQKSVPHHLINLITPEEEFSVALYQRLAIEKIKEIFNKEKNVLMTGGTGLYIKAVLEGYNLPPTSKKIRNEFKKELKISGLEKLYQRLKKIDPESSSKIHPNDSVRIIRALEVYSLTKKSISWYQKSDSFLPKCKIIKIGLEINRDILYEKIDQRIDKMIKSGLLKENKKLTKLGFREEIVNKKIIGYTEIMNHLKEEYDLKEAIDLLKKNTRNYAKRQLTWFKKDKEIFWINLDIYKNQKEIIDKILNVIKNRIVV